MKLKAFGGTTYLSILKTERANTEFDVTAEASVDTVGHGVTTKQCLEVVCTQETEVLRKKTSLNQKSSENDNSMWVRD